MPAYVIADIDVHDPDGYEEYKRLSSGSADKYGGRFVARGGPVEPLEGGWEPKRIVILEFPDRDAVRRWYDSPEYTEARAVRERTATSRFIVTEST
jgi:uncharacterized protein (DUF1330 family)